LNILPHFNCVATLPCEIQMQKKTSNHKQRVGARNILPAKMQWMICTVLDFVRSVSLDIWSIERYVCFWPLWLSKPTISSSVIMFSSVHVAYASVCWFNAFGQCCVFPEFLLITFPLFPHCSYLKNYASILRKLYFSNRYKFFIIALSPLLNGTLHHRYIASALKINIYDNIICFCLRTSEMYVKLNII